MAAAVTPPVAEAEIMILIMPNAQFMRCAGFTEDCMRHCAQAEKIWVCVWMWLIPCSHKSLERRGFKAGLAPSGYLTAVLQYFSITTVTTPVILWHATSDNKISCVGEYISDSTIQYIVIHCLPPSLFRLLFLMKNWKFEQISRTIFSVPTAANCVYWLWRDEGRGEKKGITLCKRCELRYGLMTKSCSLR